MPYQSECRCGHSHDSFHIDTLYESKYNFDVVITTNLKCNSLNCQCVKYIPKDNLEYLEWCYENKTKGEV